MKSAKDAGYRSGNGDGRPPRLDVARRLGWISELMRQAELKLWRLSVVIALGRLRPVSQPVSKIVKDARGCSGECLA
jgi:hypothetical protein